MVGRRVAGAGDGIGECPPFFGEIGEGQFVPTQSFSLSSAFFLPSRILTPLSKHHEPTYRSNTKCPKKPLTTVLNMYLHSCPLQRQHS